MFVYFISFAGANPTQSFGNAQMATNMPITGMEHLRAMEKTLSEYHKREVVIMSYQLMQKNNKPLCGDVVKL